jgi:hypothetical protein
MRTDLYFCSDRKVSSRVAATIVLAAILFSCSPTSADDWVILFNGKTLDGWKPFRDTTQFALSDGVVVATSSADTQFLHTVDEYGDFELQLEVKLHDTDLNSGVQIRTHLTRTSDDGKVRPRLHGPQVDIGKSPGRSGYIFNQGNGAWITPEEDLVRNETMTNGEWNKLRVLAIGPRIQTWINDEQVGDVANDEAYKKYPSGVIALQVHGVKRSPEKARHVSFRSIRIRKIESAK